MLRQHLGLASPTLGGGDSRTLRGMMIIDSLRGVSHEE